MAHFMQFQLLKNGNLPELSQSLVYEHCVLFFKKDLMFIKNFKMSVKCTTTSLKLGITGPGHSKI